MPAGPQPLLPRARAWRRYCRGPLAAALRTIASPSAANRLDFPAYKSPHHTLRETWQCATDLDSTRPVPPSIRSLSERRIDPASDRAERLLTDQPTAENLR